MRRVAGGGGMVQQALRRCNRTKYERAQSCRIKDLRNAPKPPSTHESKMIGSRSAWMRSACMRFLPSVSGIAASCRRGNRQRAMGMISPRMCAV